MVSFNALVRRHCRIYYMDKATVIASLLMPMILIFLYLTILKNVYVSSFTELLPAGAALPDGMTNGFIYGWLFAGLLAASGVTVSFCSNIIISAAPRLTVPERRDRERRRIWTRIPYRRERTNPN